MFERPDGTRLQLTGFLLVKAHGKVWPSRIWRTLKGT